MTRCNFCSQPSRAASILRTFFLLSFGLLILAGSVQAETSTQRNPTFTFTSPGSKPVTLRVCNANGCNSVTKTVVVLDPLPKIASAGFPLLVGTGQAISLQATTSGRPPLTHRWILSSIGFSDVVLTGNPVVWNTPASARVFTARLEVTNVDGAVGSLPSVVTVIGASFADVPTSYWAWKWIENLHSRGVSTTCGSAPLRFCPDAAMTRGEMAVFLLRAKQGSAYNPPACVTPSFADVPCSNPLSPWVNELVRRGVTAGCGGGNYCPNNPVTRDQMAVFLIVTQRGAGYVPAACVSAPFTDVPCSSPFAPWVKELVTLGVTAGCGSGNYCPSQTVTRAQMSIFISTMFNLPPP